MEHLISGLKLTKASHEILLKEYKKRYGKDYDGTGPKFGVLGNLRVKDGTGNCCFVDAERFQKVQKYIKRLKLIE